MTAEEWRTVVGWPHYEVSSQGRIRSNHTYHRRPGRILTTTEDRYGYAITRLRSAGSATRMRVHKLMAEAFFGPAEGRVTRHLNGNPSDNRLENLAYGTQSENLYDAVRHGTHYWAARTHCHQGHEYTPENTHKKPSRAGRICLTCYREKNRKKSQRQRDARRTRLQEQAAA